MNGQAKIDFEKWLKLNHGYDFTMTTYLKEVMLNALIIEWFDTIGTWILINPVDNKDDWFFQILEEDLMSPFFEVFISDADFRNRQQATEKAIEKAIILYNEKFK